MTIKYSSYTLGCSSKRRDRLINLSHYPKLSLDIFGFWSVRVDAIIVLGDWAVYHESTNDVVKLEVLEDLRWFMRGARGNYDDPYTFDGIVVVSRRSAHFFVFIILTLFQPFTISLYKAFAGNSRM